MEDWALVVGITAYPGISALSGPERDAVDFYNWVTAAKPEGGGVDPDPNTGRAKLIITSTCIPPPPYQLFLEAKPTMERINEVFEGMYALAQKNNAAGKGRQIGRRLYLYFAGHGLEPKDEVALLMANATEGIWNNHISGTGWANWLYKAGLFEEILLFMDCCRDYFPSVAPNPVFPELLAGNNMEKKRFYAFATAWGKKSWEREMEDKQVHGVFTTTLMKGLRGAACDRFTGQITTTSLRGYLKDTMQFFFTEQDRKNPAIRKDPTLPDFGDPDFTIAKVTQIPSYQITVKLPSEFQNQDLQLIYGSGLQMQIIDLKTASTTLPLTLSRGSYTLRIKGAGGIAKGFDVRGIGPEDVTPN